MLNVLDVFLGQGFVISIVSTGIAVVAFIFSLRGAHRDRINANSWGTYEAYNSTEVRAGRDIALKTMARREQHGFQSRVEYGDYFNGMAKDLQKDAGTLRQSMHDLAAFYHQTGVLLYERRLDRDFTLLLVGPGLEDRWPVMDSISQIYVMDATTGDFPYGGMYILYTAYKQWKEKRFMKLRKQFIKMREEAIRK